MMSIRLYCNPAVTWSQGEYSSDCDSESESESYIVIPNRDLQISLFFLNEDSKSIQLL